MPLNYQTPPDPPARLHVLPYARAKLNQFDRYDLDLQHAQCRALFHKLPLHYTRRVDQRISWQRDGVFKLPTHTLLDFIYEQGGAVFLTNTRAVLMEGRYGLVPIRS